MCRTVKHTHTHIYIYIFLPITFPLSHPHPKSQSSPITLPKAPTHIFFLPQAERFMNEETPKRRYEKIAQNYLIFCLLSLHPPPPPRHTYPQHTHTQLNTHRHSHHSNQQNQAIPRENHIEVVSDSYMTIIATNRQIFIMLKTASAG